MDERKTSGRPDSAITPKQVEEGLAFVSYVPGKEDTVVRGTFTSKPYWADDESAHVVGVNIDEAHPGHSLSRLGPRVVELCFLGIGSNRHGDVPSRVCVPGDGDETD